ncbi:MAG: GGDEF domain-containing protein [Spirochaetes bacterium]|nr:GGDEF domain-containing protein [Spirochaetota bacterium]
MNFKLKQTNLLLIISIILLLSLVFFNIYVLLEFKRFRNEANIINSAGKIRGNIQRVVRKELSGENPEDGIKIVEEFFDNFRNKKPGYEVTERENVFYKELDNFSNEWNNLLNFIEEYRKNGSETAKINFLEKSEICWTLSNKLVLLTQVSYEDKLSFFNIVFIANAVFMIGIFLIIMITRNHIQLKLEKMANYDGLTNVRNRYAYNETMKNELYKRDRYGEKLSLIIFDIDHFKLINDNHGHKTGDAILKKIAELAGSVLRKSDLLFRVGGEEFCIILSNSTLEAGIIAAEKVRKTVENHEFIHNEKVTVSFGVAEPLDNENSDSLFKRADNCLYSAKNNGRNQVWASKTADECYRAD